MPRICQKHNVSKDKYNNCPECLKIYRKKYLSTDKGKKISRECSRRHRQYQSEKCKELEQKYRNTPQGKIKRKARDLVRYSIKTGGLIKLPCLICSNPQVEAHHLYGYDKENSLRVVFLCHKHHVLADHNPEFNEKIKVLVNNTSA
jgi:hypothetical protein